MANTINDKIQKLQECRKKVEEIAQKRMRITGEIDGHKKRLVEIEEKCKKDYDCEISELPGLVTQLGEEADRAIKESERILSVPAKQETPDPPVQSVQQVEVKKEQPKVVPSPKRQPKNIKLEEDVLGE